MVGRRTSRGARSNSRRKVSARNRSCGCGRKRRSPRTFRNAFLKQLEQIEKKSQQDALASAINSHASLLIYQMNAPSIIPMTSFPFNAATSRYLIGVDQASNDSSSTLYLIELENDIQVQKFKEHWYNANTFKLKGRGAERVKYFAKEEFAWKKKGVRGINQSSEEDAVRKAATMLFEACFGQFDPSGFTKTKKGQIPVRKDAKPSKTQQETDVLCCELFAMAEAKRKETRKDGKGWQDATPEDDQYEEDSAPGVTHYDLSQGEQHPTTNKIGLPTYTAHV